MWSGLGFIPFAMATPSMRHIFLQAFQSFKIAFFPFEWGWMFRDGPRQVNPLSVFKYENNAKNVRMKGGRLVVWKLGLLFGKPSIFTFVLSW